jgi:hypothetical protein
MNLLIITESFYTFVEQLKIRQVKLWDIIVSGLVFWIWEYKSLIIIILRSPLSLISCIWVNLIIDLEFSDNYGKYIGAQNLAICYELLNKHSISVDYRKLSLDFALSL